MLLTIPWNLPSVFLQKILEKQTPIKTKFNKALTLNDKHWVSRAVRKSIKIRIKLYKQYWIEKDLAKKNFYMKSLKPTGTRTSRKNYSSKYLKEIKKDTKRIWSAIKTIVNVKPMHNYQHLSLAIENKAVLNLRIMSTHFNKFFTQITSKIDKKIGKGVKKPPDYLHHK